MRARSVWLLPLAIAVAAVAWPSRVWSASPCAHADRREVARAVRIAGRAHQQAARAGGVPELSGVARADVPEGCRDAAVVACRDLAELCYGDAFDRPAGAFPQRVADRCAQATGALCRVALQREVAAAGTGTPSLERIARRCGDPVTADLGGACDGTTGNAAARACLAVEVARLALAVDPWPPAGTCGFAGASVVKPVVPGTEFDPVLSPWRIPLAAGQEYEPQAAERSQMDYVASSGPGLVNLSVREWTFPVYNVVASRDADCAASLRDRCFDRVAVEDVYLTRPWNPTGHAIRHVPIPAAIAMRPDPAGDSHVAIVDWVHGIEYDFWACAKNADGTWKKTVWPSSRGGDGAYHYTCQAGGKLWLRGTGNNVIGPDSAKGSGFALTAGLIRPEEIVGAGAIAHALALTIAAPASGGPVAPAVISDGTGPAYPGAPPEGARLQLRPETWTDAAIDARPWSAVEKKIARALRDYGGIVGDGGGWNVDLHAEGTAYRPDLYAGVPGVGPDAATSIFDPEFFTHANFHIVRERPQVGDNDEGSRDSDGDGMFDAFETAMGWVDRVDPGSPPNAGADPDGDGLTNLEEQRCLHATWPGYVASWSGFAANPPFQYPCNANDADTDHDGFADRVELTAQTDPTDPCEHP